MDDYRGGKEKRGFAVVALTVAVLCLSLTACAGTGEKTAQDASEPETTGVVAEDASKPETADMSETASEPETAGASQSSAESAAQKGSEPAPAEDTADQGGRIEDWARAFCRRDGDTIAAMSGDAVKDTMTERELLAETENGYGFGWSSPWPWDEETDYEIIEETDDSAVILYYAWVSDPHVTVWRETLTYRTENGRCIVEEEELEILDHICTGEEYARAYPHGINGTRMDYTDGGIYEDMDESVGKALNDNALLSSSRAYRMLFAPETAAAYLLNFLDNPDKVSASAEDTEQEDGSVLVSFAFAEDGSSLTVKMIQPYGREGIWIPQDNPVNIEPGLEVREE